MQTTTLDALPIEFQQFNETVHSLSRLLMQRRLFPSSHPSVEKALSEAFLRVEILLQRKKDITFRFTRGFVHYLNFRIDIVNVDDRAVHLFRETLGKLSIGEIDFKKGMTKDELTSFIEFLEGASRQERNIQPASAWLQIRNIGIRNSMNEAQTDLGTDEEALGAKPKREHALSKAKGGREDSKVGRLVSSVLQRLEKIESLEGKMAGQRILGLIEMAGENASIVLLLKSLQQYDDYTFVHSVNVAVVSTAIAAQLGWEEQEINAISMAALLHDIGKIYVPRRIIHKTGRLSPIEWQLMKKHPVDGERILREESVCNMHRRVAYEHHMRYDFKGYPNSKEDYQQLMASQIVRIADSYDALTTRRPYRKQLGPYQAIRVMDKSRGHEFHPHLLNIFLSVLGNIPIGSILKLDTGEIVLVVDISKKFGELPRVRILMDAKDNKVNEEIILDLNEKNPVSNKYKRRIIGIADDAIRNIDVGKYLVNHK